MGGLPRTVYVNFKKVSGIEVLWYGSLLPLILRPFGAFISSYKGVIKIKDRSKLLKVFNSLSEMSMVGLYVINKGLENDFIDNIKRNNLPEPTDLFVKENDDEFFIYQIDADNYESSTGMCEIISFGSACPQEIISIVKM
jgi:hypothetical protein